MTQGISRGELAAWHDEMATAVVIDQQVFRGAFMRGENVIDPDDPEGCRLSGQIEGKMEVLASFREFLAAKTAEVTLLDDDEPSSED